MENSNPIFQANPYRHLYGRQPTENGSEKGRSAKSFKIAYENALRDFLRQLTRCEDRRTLKTKGVGADSVWKLQSAPLSNQSGLGGAPK